MVSLRDYPRYCCGLSGASTGLLPAAIDCVDAPRTKKKTLNALHPALQRLLEDHRDHYKHPRPAERGCSAISLGLSQSAALNATAGAYENRGTQITHCIMPAKRGSPTR